MSKSIEVKAPRLHRATTLDDAAAWLTYWSREAWDAPAVLGRFRELAHECNAHAALSLESMKVVVSAGTVLIDKMTGERKLLQRHMTLLIGGHAVGGFLVDLHEHGEAIPAGLVSECGPPIRWAIETPLTGAAVRLSPFQVESLLPAFDRLTRDVVRGDHPQLLRDANLAEQGFVEPSFVFRGPSERTDAATLQELRQARRYQMCIDAGLKMPTNDYAALPRGIGRVAATEQISRQAFAQDVRAHINRLETAGKRQANGKRLPADP